MAGQKSEQAAFCSAVPSSSALVVVQVGSTVHGGNTGDHPTGDPPDACDVLVALAVPELEAAREIVVAVAKCAFTGARPVTARIAKSRDPLGRVAGTIQKRCNPCNNGVRRGRRELSAFHHPPMIVPSGQSL